MARSELARIRSTLICRPACILAGTPAQEANISFRLLLCSAAFCVAVSVIRAQEFGTFQEAYSGDHVFALRDAVQRPSATEFYKAAVEASANDVPRAVEHLRSVIAADPHSNDANRAHDLLANLFFRNGRYQDGLKEIEAALKEHPDAEDAKNMLPLARALGRMPAMQVASRKASKLQMRRGSTPPPLKLNGKRGPVLFRYRSWLLRSYRSRGQRARPGSTDGEEYDGRLKWKGRNRHPSRAGKRCHDRGPASSPCSVSRPLRRGRALNSLPLNRRGIIGLPIYLLTRTLRWSPAGAFEFAFPAGSLNQANCNMLFHNSNPVIDVRVEGETLGLYSRYRRGREQI